MIHHIAGGARGVAKAFSFGGGGGGGVWKPTCWLTSVANIFCGWGGGGVRWTATWNRSHFREWNTMCYTIHLQIQSANPQLLGLPTVNLFGTNSCSGTLDASFADWKKRRTCEVPMVLPEPYFSLSDSRDTSCAIRFFSELVPQLRDSWDNTWVLPQTETIPISTMQSLKSYMKKNIK